MHESRWRVLYVITNQEKRVAQHLTARSLEHYLPLYTEHSRWTDRAVSLERPLFAGYIFARFAQEARVSVLSTPGVLRLLGETERDTVSEKEIARIRESLASGCILRPYRGAAPRNSVRVLRGVFEGAEGVVTDFRKQCKVVMTLSATGQLFTVEVDFENLEVLHKPVVKEIAICVRPRVEVYEATFGCIDEA
jgi:transcriptional antiterminator NusG